MIDRCYDQTSKLHTGMHMTKHTAQRVAKDICKNENIFSVIRGNDLGLNNDSHNDNLIE